MPIILIKNPDSTYQVTTDPVKGSAVKLVEISVDFSKHQVAHLLSSLSKQFQTEHPNKFRAESDQTIITEFLKWVPILLRPIKTVLKFELAVVTTPEELIKYSGIREITITKGFINVKFMETERSFYKIKELLDYLRSWFPVDIEVKLEDFEEYICGLGKASRSGLLTDKKHIPEFEITKLNDLLDKLELRVFTNVSNKKTILSRSDKDTVFPNLSEAFDSMVADLTVTFDPALKAEFIKRYS